jgi:Mn-dependent DtxR family transcriptional regulator
MQIREAAENYLETIFILSQKLENVRSIDIATELNYSKPTISVMMKQFRENGYILMDSDSYITLTSKGLEIAERLYERHEVIASILMSIGVDEQTAYEDSCKIEHDLSEESFQAMKAHYLRKR